MDCMLRTACAGAREGIGLLTTSLAGLGILVRKLIFLMILHVDGNLPFFLFSFLAMLSRLLFLLFDVIF